MKRLCLKNKLFLENISLENLSIFPIIIKVAYSGICGTDLQILKKNYQIYADELCLGHEIVGYIYKGNSKFNENQPVVINPNHQCNHCSYCLIGKPNFCENIQSIGIYQNGGWSEYIGCSESIVHLYYKDVPIYYGILCEPYSCILHGYNKLGKIVITDKILIIGAGIIGLLWVLFLHYKGYRDIIIIESDINRRQIVLSFEFKGLKVKEINDENINIIIDCSGVPIAIESNIKWLKKVGKILLFGCCPKNQTLSIEPYFLYDHEIDIITAKINPFTFPEAISLVKELFNSDYLDFNLGVKYYTIDSFELALDELNSKKCTKAVFEFK